VGTVRPYTSGNRVENADDGSGVAADETEHGGDFREDVKDSTGKMKHEHGKRGDREDEVETEDSGFNGDRAGDWRQAAS
jgi:hypothetical protein